MADKDFKTIDEQIEILRSRGLTIEDEAEAKDFLLRNNYYRVSGYSLTLRKNDVFAKSATFQNIEDIYNFDHEFRHIILHHIETIEVQIKSIYAYLALNSSMNSVTMFSKSSAEAWSSIVPS